MRPAIKDVDFAVDEHIWGHRLYDEQLPHMAVLEFLGILASNRISPLRPPSAGEVTYRPQRQIRLRSLLFNNPYIETIRAREVSDEDKWRQWTERFTEDCAKLENGDMSYLRNVFNTFDDFAKAVELLRSSSFEARSNKRWSSKFVFPFGPDALYEDLRIGADGAASNDRRFFARTGELLYLMLTRAENGAKLGDLLVERLFDRKAPMNRLVRALQGETQTSGSDKTVGYLPHATHPRFDRLCDDWLAILSRDMPVYDALEHLMASAGLNLLLYFLECGKAQAGDVDPVELICEIVSRERTKVRALSGESYQFNQGLSLRAIRASVESVRLTDEWTKASESDEPNAQSAALMRSWFQWPPENGSDGSVTGDTTGDMLIKSLVDMAESRHEQHFGKIHAAWSRAVGLSSRRLSRRTRYAPNDKLLKTLVISMVDDRMQFDEFLSEIRNRYGMIIGDAEGGRLMKEKLVDQEALSDNRENLEARLVGLGLVRRLSDSCSFVENPFTFEVAQ
ncbi:hypothetical protein [Polaromonas naphthalenivorans]|uniref:Uncharacterized protein n=1 Tax=Polaromonas naphthalenivorans (strain CJ2) TaxID=365044 RepID=A1VW29_POLNA|nr:hypothetical protein [Polaromonas naphthalenivorans]ABM39857.1 hypothetical protein Pnap_4589 [Polaromonas naphthalenivorans CJ2]